MSGDFLWKALLCEFVGSFILIFSGCAVVALNTAQGGSTLNSALAFGLALATLFWAWGNVSGAHFNPAVSFGFAVAGRMNWGLMFAYWIAQLLGGILAGLVLWWLFNGSNLGASVGVWTYSQQGEAVFLEALITFFLVMTVLLVTRNPMLAIISGLAIGLTLTFDMLVAYNWTGGSANPARSLGPAIFSNNMGSYWIYVVGPLIGALVAALIFRLFDTDWSCKVKTNDCGEPLRNECGEVISCCERPVLDACGNPMKDCDGNWMTQSYDKIRHAGGFMQETPVHALAHWLEGMGVPVGTAVSGMREMVGKAAGNTMKVAAPVAPTATVPLMSAAPRTPRGSFPAAP